MARSFSTPAVATPLRQRSAITAETLDDTGGESSANNISDDQAFELSNFDFVPEPNDAQRTASVYSEIQATTRSNRRRYDETSDEEDIGFLSEVDFDGLTQQAIQSSETLADKARTQLSLVTDSFRDIEDSLSKDIDLGPVRDFMEIKNIFDSGFSVNGNKPNLGSDGHSESKLPNPLREHNHYNYIATLGILSPDQLADPSSYRDLGEFDNYILRSGGGFLDKRYQVFAEEILSDEDNSTHAEYYMEDLVIDAVVSPNPNTGVSLGTSVSFSVIEPFSMGKFTQAIIGASRKKRWGSHTSAAFCLKIEFIGWDENGITSQQVTKPLYIPIQIVNIEFGVSGAGSEYQVTAVPFTEVALRDRINEIKTTSNISGGTVHQALVSGSRSLTNVLNERIEQLENNDVISSSDRYIICFPADPSDVTRVAAGEREREDELSISSSETIYERLYEFAIDESKMNVIGLSALSNDHHEGSDQPMDWHEDLYDEENQVLSREANDLHRNYQHHQGDSITRAIEDIVNDSVYAESQVEERSNTGLDLWYRINTHVFVEENTATEMQVGRPPMVYVFSVIPYAVDEAKNLPRTENPANTKVLKDLALKTYNYIYTGKNEDVLAFDINFNTTYLSVLSNYGQNKGQQAPGFGNVKTATGASSSDDLGTELPRALQEQSEVRHTVDESTEYAGTASSNTRSVDIKESLAAMFHNNIINNNVNMVNAEMTIWGDPFFIPQQTGNYIGKSDKKASGITDDMTMDYLSGDVFINLNFMTPLDYSVAGDTMTFLDRVSEFSGLFTVWAVENSFSKGRFTQVLKMLRRPGQTDEETDGRSSQINTADKSISDIIEQRRQVNSFFEPEFPVGSLPSSPAVSPLDTKNTPNIFSQVQTTPPVITVNGVTFSPQQSVFQQLPSDSELPDQTTTTPRTQNPASND